MGPHHLTKVIVRKDSDSVSQLSLDLGRKWISMPPKNQKGKPMGIWELTTTFETLSNHVLSL
jgi:hypothetical protein